MCRVVVLNGNSFKFDNDEFGSDGLVYSWLLDI